MTGLEDVCKFNPKVLKQTICSIEFNWNPINGCEVYKIEQKLKYDQWQTVYWGSNTKHIVKHLEQNVCYVFRLFALKIDAGKYICIESSKIFKGLTLPDVPSTISLNRAIKKSDMHVLRRFLTAKPDLIDVPGPNGLTPLGVAVSCGDNNCVELLLTYGVNINIGSPLIKRTPLQIAVFNGYIDIARTLINKKADKNKIDIIGMTWGHYSIDGGHLSAVKFCIDNGVDIEQQDHCGWTMLLRAFAMNSSLDIIKLLLDNHANILAVDNNKFSCIKHANFTKNDKALELIKNFSRKSNMKFDEIN